MEKFFENILANHKEKNPTKYEESILTLLFGTLSIFIGIAYTILSISLNYPTIAISTAVYVLLTTVIMFLVNKNPQNDIWKHAFVFALSVILIISLFFNVTESSPLLWVFIYPVVIIMIYKNKNAIFISAIFFVLVTVLLFIPFEKKPELSFILHLLH